MSDANFNELMIFSMIVIALAVAIVKLLRDNDVHNSRPSSEEILLRAIELQLKKEGFASIPALKTQAESNFDREVEIFHERLLKSQANKMPLRK